MSPTRRQALKGAALTVTAIALFPELPAAAAPVAGVPPRVLPAFERSDPVRCVSCSAYVGNLTIDLSTWPDPTVFCAACAVKYDESDGSYDDGYDDGYQEGRERGFDDGKEEGLEEAEPDQHLLLERMWKLRWRLMDLGLQSTVEQVDDVIELLKV